MGTCCHQNHSIAIKILIAATRWGIRNEKIGVACASPPKGDPGKNVTFFTELKEPMGEELEFSPDSSMGSESEVEINGASGQRPTGGPAKRRKHVVRKIPASKLVAGATASRDARGSMPMTGSEERGAMVSPQAAEEEGVAVAAA